MPPELPIRASLLRDKLGIGSSRFSAIKRKLGLRHRRFVSEKVVVDFLIENPSFQEKEIYHRPGCGCDVCGKKRQNQQSGQCVGAAG